MSSETEITEAITEMTQAMLKLAIAINNMMVTLEDKHPDIWSPEYDEDWQRD